LIEEASVIKPPFREHFIPEAEKKPLLEVVTRKRALHFMRTPFLQLMKTLPSVDLAMILMLTFVTAHGFLVGKSEGKPPSPRPRCRQEDNIRTDLKYIGCEGFIRLRIETTGGLL
jgi:hypothetical protein